MKKAQTLLVALMMLTISTTCAFAAIDANTLPVLDRALNGDVITNGNTMNVNTRGAAGTVGQFDWTSFDVGANKTVNWTFDNHSQTALNRVLGSNLSQIYGKLTNSCSVAGCNMDTTSKVILINPNGIMFGNGSSVNLNSFTASTFDAVGAKNLKDMSASELNTYKAGLTGKFGYNVPVTFQGSTTAQGNKVTLENSTWNVDKSAAIVAKEIDLYKGSQISTSKIPNYGSGTQSFSNIKLITSNGVDFTYKANGYINNNINVKDGLAGVDYKMNVGNSSSTLTTDAALNSGSVLIENAGKTAGSTLKVAKTAIKGYKLVESAPGEINLLNKYGTLDVDSSNLITYNTTNAGGTLAKSGGGVNLQAGSTVNVANTSIQTASSTLTDESGSVRFLSENGNIKLDNVNVASNGNVTAATNNGKLTITSSNIEAKDTSTAANAKDVILAATTGVDTTGSTFKSTKDIKTLATNGDVNSTSSTFNAKSGLAFIGKNTKLENSTLSFKNLALHDGTNNNNVTIKGTTTLDDTDSQDLALDVKGNLTVDNATLKKTSSTKQRNLQANATGDVTVKNSSNVETTGKIDLVAGNNAVGQNSTLKSATTLSMKGKNVTLTSLTANAGSTSTLNATNGALSVASSNVQGTQNTLTSTGNTTITGSTIKATSGNNALNAGGNSTITGSTLTATSDNTVGANNVTINGSSILTAKNNTITATTNASVDNNVKITATNGDNTVTATNGTATIDNNSNLTASNHNKVLAKGTASLKGGSTMKASANNSLTSSNADTLVHTATMDGVNNVVTAQTTAKSYKGTFKATNDTQVTGKVADIECSTFDSKNNTIASTNGAGIVKDTQMTASETNDVTATQKQTIQNSVIKGKNNTIASSGANVTIANAKLEATTKNKVNAYGDIEFKYDSTIECPATGCIAPVTEVSIKGSNNEITAGGDINTGSLIIKKNTTNPEDTVTEFTAGGDFRTGAKVVYDPMDNVYTPADTTGTIIGEGALDTGKTKVYINAGGNINLVLKNTDNQKAGLELNGKKIEMIAEDGTLSLSRVIAKDLYIDETNRYIAGETTLTAQEKAVDSYAPKNPDQYKNAEGTQAAMPGRGYIQAERFNFDYAPALVAVGGIYQGSFNEVKNASGSVTDYAKHFVNLNADDTTNGQFVLSYKKPFACEPPPPVDPDVSDISAITHLPFQNQSMSNATPITNNLTNPVSNVIAAAAAIDIDNEEQYNY